MEQQPLPLFSAGSFLSTVVVPDSSSQQNINSVTHKRHSQPSPQPFEAPPPFVPTLQIPVERATFSLSSKVFRLPTPLKQMPVIDDMPIAITPQMLPPNRLTGSSPVFKFGRAISAMPFDSLATDSSVSINPRQLGFIPATNWANEPIWFGLLVASFFRKRNSPQSKFIYKLYNALKLASQCPEFIPHVGVHWINDEIIQVDREPFARLLGVKTVEGGLFNQQGNFPSHGFVELSFQESEELAKAYNLPTPVDLGVLRFVRHSRGFFTRNSTESEIEKCQWNSQ